MLRMFRKKKEPTMAEALTRQGVDVTVDPGATLLEGLETYWPGRENDIFVNFTKYPHLSWVSLTPNGSEIATIRIDELHVDDTNLCVWGMYVAASPESGLYLGSTYQCNSIYDLTGNIVHV